MIYTSTSLYCLQIFPKYWLGGPDPLDYISMYSNPGDPARQIPPHWHYVSFGLSDLHGDGRVHDLQQQQQQVSNWLEVGE